MGQNNKAIIEYLSCNPSSFDLLDRWNIQQHEIFEDEYSSRYTLSVEIWLSPDLSQKPHARLQLVFGDVQELRFQQRFIPFVLHLNIRTLSEDQWEDLRYAVSDEEGILSFYCKSFETHLVSTS